MYSPIPPSRTDGRHALSQSAPLVNRHSPQSALRTDHAMPSRTATRQLHAIRPVQPTADKLRAASLIASPAPVPSDPFRPRFGLINQPALHTRYSGITDIPNDPSPIIGHSNPPLWHPSSANVGATPSRPSLISIADKSHNPKENSPRLSASASNQIFPHPRQPRSTKRP